MGRRLVARGLRIQTAGASATATPPSDEIWPPAHGSTARSSHFRRRHPDRSGRTAHSTERLRRLSPTIGTIGNLIDIKWQRDGKMAFRCKTRDFPLQDAHARASRTLCNVLVYNYPSMLRDPGPENELTTTNPSLDVWQLKRSSRRIELWWSPVNGMSVLAGAVTSSRHATKMARHLSGNCELEFHPHAWIDNTTTLWRAADKMTKNAIRERLQLPARTTSLDEVAERSSRWMEWNPGIAAALDDIEWDDTQLFLHDAFSLRLNTIPSKLWTRPEISRLPKPTPYDTSVTHQAEQAAWRLQVLATLHTIWRWRTDTEVRDEIWSSAQARAYHDRCLRATLVDVRWKSQENSAASSHTAAALESLRSSDPENEFPPTSTSAESERRYILFFDGGSRGNPGPGGSGAVIVSTNQVATVASIIWSAAMSSVKPTNNYQAEYRSVLEGLRAAQNHRWLPLDVVGDSQLILGQLRQYCPPRATSN